MPIKFVHKGDLKKTNTAFQKWLSKRNWSILDHYGKMGVDALKAATPVDTGKTANSWSYRIVRNEDIVQIIWSNSNTTEDGIPIVVLLQYGHGTGNGGYVQGRDFINPTMKPIFDEIAEKVWKEVTKA